MKYTAITLLVSNSLAISLGKGEMQMVPDYFDRGFDEVQQNKFDGLYHETSGKVVDSKNHEVKMIDNINVMTSFFEDYEKDIAKIEFQGSPIAVV